MGHGARSAFVLVLAFLAASRAFAELPPIPPDELLVQGSAGLEVPAAVHGNIAIVGHPGGLNLTGSVQIFERVQNPCTTPPCWTFSETLVAPDTTLSNGFGASIAFDGVTALIGAPSAEAGLEAIYVYRYGPAGWVLKQKILNDAPEGPTNFGRHVVLSGNTFATTSVGYFGRGAVYMYERGAGGLWKRKAKFTPAEVVPEDQFGYSLAMSGDTVFVGANGIGAGGGEGIGSVHIYTKHRGTWKFVQTLISSDGNVGFFGQSVAVQGPIAVVGASAADLTFQTSGAAYVFIRGPRGWRQYQRIQPTTDTLWQGFGTSVAIRGWNIGVTAINSPGGALYVFQPVRLRWKDTLKFAFPSFPQSENQGIAFDGKTLIIGSADGSRFVWNLKHLAPHANRF